MIQGGHNSCVKCEGLSYKEELYLLCGLPRALDPGISQNHMIKGGISMNFLAICRLEFRAR